MIDNERKVQLRLSTLNEKRFNPAYPGKNWRADIEELAEFLIVEGEFLEASRSLVLEQASQAPSDASKFVKWFEDLKINGPGQQDRLFSWLSDLCTLSEMKWFLTQEVAGEAGFEDLTALTQIKLPSAPKLELARNYWDEMGRGNPKAMHGPLLEILSRHLQLRPTLETTVTEALALANTMAGLAANRRYAYHSVGALGVIEMTAPARSAATSAGLKRLGIKAGDRHYFSLHAILDVKHSLAWNSQAIMPLVMADSHAAAAIAEGALMRLQCGARCFDRYRKHFNFQTKGLLKTPLETIQARG
ncbi:MAG: iron-containing redox enzyme family protein [Nitrobacter sp.]